MPEKLTPKHEKGGDGHKEKLKLSAEQKAEKAELKADNKAEREAKIEHTKEKIEKSLDRQARPEAQHDTSERAKVESDQPKLVGRRERDAAFQKAMKDVRAQLSPAQRSFSRLAHAKPVEVVSEFLEETVYRPSFLWGGVIGGLLIGGGLMAAAYLQGYRLSGTEIIFGLFAGGIVGILVEFLFRGRRRSQ